MYGLDSLSLLLYSTQKWFHAPSQHMVLLHCIALLCRLFTHIREMTVYCRENTQLSQSNILLSKYWILASVDYSAEWKIFLVKRRMILFRNKKEIFVMDVRVYCVVHRNGRTSVLCCTSYAPYIIVNMYYAVRVCSAVFRCTWNEVRQLCSPLCQERVFFLHGTVQYLQRF